MDLFDGPSLVEANRSFVQHRGMLQSFESWLSEAFSDDAADARGYLHEAELGHYLVIVHAPQDAVVERASKVLHAHGAHSMRHYELLTVTDL